MLKFLKLLTVTTIRLFNGTVNGKGNTIIQRPAIVKLSNEMDVLVAYNDLEIPAGRTRQFYFRTVMVSILSIVVFTLAIVFGASYLGAERYLPLAIEVLSAGVVMMVSTRLLLDCNRRHDEFWAYHARGFADIHIQKHCVNKGGKLVKVNLAIVSAGLVSHNVVVTEETWSLNDITGTYGKVTA